MPSEVKSIDQPTAKRLALIRYIAGAAKRHAEAREPEAVLGLLLLHDAAELLVDLIVSTHPTNPKRPNEFMAAWKLLAGLDPPVSLTHEAAMARMNRARVSLKHHGILPAKDDLPGYVSTVDAFLSVNTLAVFGVQLEEVSLIQLIELTQVREPLLKAEREWGKGRVNEAAGQAAIAFDALMRIAEGTLQDLPPENAAKLPFLARRLQRSLQEHQSPELHHLHEFVGAVTTAVSMLSTRFRIAAFGIDYARWADFRATTPHVVAGASDGHPAVLEPRKSKPTAEAVRRAIDFVIEAALRMTPSRGAD